MTDLSTLSDAQLLDAAKKAGIDVTPPSSPLNPGSIYSNMSDADLLQAAKDKGIQVTPPPFKPTDPTEGMNWWDVAAASAGRTLEGMGKGVLQRAYELASNPYTPFNVLAPFSGAIEQQFKPQYEALQSDKVQRDIQDKALMDRAGSGWGEFAANTIPFLTLPAKIPAAAGGALFGALQQTGPGETPLMNMMTGAGMGKLGQTLGSMAGSGLSWLKGQMGNVAQSIEKVLPAMKDGRADSLYKQVPNAPGADQPFPVQSFLDRLVPVFRDFEDVIPGPIKTRIQEFRAGQLANEGQIPAASGAAPREMTIAEASSFSRLINQRFGNAAPGSSEAGAAAGLRQALRDAGDELGEGNLAWQSFRQANQTFSHDAVLGELQDALQKGPGKLGQAMDEMGPNRLQAALSPQELSRISVLRMADESRSKGGGMFTSAGLGALAGPALEHGAEVLGHSIPGGGMLTGALLGMMANKAMGKIGEARANAMLIQPTLADLVAQVAGARAGPAMPSLGQMLPNLSGQQSP